ncbi:MAG TPA: V-type ATP synthase subunit I [Methanoregula sp.]|nr:V-type ATP synthase subunit I [Methanoregula sp.]
MLTPKQMSRLLIVASSDQYEPVIRELYRSYLFHIEDFVVEGREGYDGFSIGKPLLGASEVSSDLVKVRTIENAFLIRSSEIEPTGKRPTAELRSTIEQELPAIEHELGELTGRRSRLELALKEYEQKITEILPFTEIPMDMEMYRGYSGFTVLAGYVSKEVNLPEPAEVYLSPGKTRRFIVAVFQNDRRGDVDRILLEANFQAVSIPVESGMPRARIDAYKEQVTQVKAEIDQSNRRLDEIRDRHREFLVACEELLKADIDRAEAPLRFATIGQTFVAEGWVPKDRVASLQDALNGATGGKVFVTELTVGEHDPVPVEYDNPPFARPSQLLMDTYSRPKYTELDPTVMVSIVFPIFFGLILGDVGYGALLLVMCLGLRKFIKGEEGQQLIAVLRNASISSIFFGVLYSEFLGFPMPWPYLLPSRHLNIGAHATGHGPNIPGLMMMAIWIGIVHITLGRVLGIVNHAQHDHGAHRTKAVLANAGWILMIWGILLLIWSMIPMPYMTDLTGLPPVVMGLNVSALIGIAVLVVGIICIARESALEIVELPTIFSHSLSYSRLVAVGLSSVAIAMVVNYIAIGMLIEPQLENITLIGVLFIIMGVLVFLIGHVMNTVLGILGGSLHSVRLHYVEFFTKFYKGGGIKYSPFGFKRRFTED